MFRDSLEISATSVDEAIDKAMAALGIESRNDVDVDVLDKGSGGIGYSAYRKPARVRVTQRVENFGWVRENLPDSIAEAPPELANTAASRLTLSPGAPKRRHPSPKPTMRIEEAPKVSVSEMGIAPSRAKTRDAYEPNEEENAMFREAVKTVLDACDMEYEADFEHKDYQRVFLRFGDREAGAIIGKRGSGIDALEHVLGRIVSQKAGHAVPVQADVNEYRARRDEELQAMARELAKRTLDSGEENHFEPMNPRERRVVHLAIQDMGGLQTYTVGDGNRRRVVVAKVE